MAEMNEVVFGRIKQPIDPRDLNFPMSVPTAPLPLWKYHRLPITRLDQNGWPECVAFCGNHFLGNAPIMTPRTQEQARADYRWCKANDGIPNIDGTYVRVMLKCLQSQGRISEYVWAQSKEQLTTWLLLKGPAMVGTEWYEGMSNTVNGVMHRTGSLLGGHAYLIVGYSSIRKMFRILNSWGKTWADKGQAWIDEDVMWSLLADNYGECAAAIEMRL